MRKPSVFLFCCAWSASLALGQTSHIGAYTTYLPVTTSPVTTGVESNQANVTPLPTWNYSITAVAGLGGDTYTGVMIGRSPYSRGKTTTTIPTQIVPLIITINNGAGDNVTYDPTAADTCVPGHTDVDIVTNSPIFTNNTWTMNSVNVGSTQYLDAFQRAQFWSLVSGTSYHLLLNESTLSGQILTFGSAGTSGPGSNYGHSSTGGCEPLGIVQIADLNTAIQALITGPLAAMVNAGTFPLFLTKNVVSASSGTSLTGGNCCILGYHSGLTVGPNLQVYSMSSLDTALVFYPGYISALSHEIAEAINDPTTTNATPAWGNEGQTVGCQSNLEVGDPLTPGGATPTNEWTITGANGLNYDLQELAFFSWFFGGPSVGTSTTSYSDNGTFTGFAKACPPGGSN